MKPKMQSAIERITLNDATFTGEVIEPTFVNFFYGKNGAGKSTIARSLRDNTGIEWKNGKSASDYDVLTYNTEFIDANFANYGNLAGVFTVCETNIEVQKKIEALQADKSAVAEEYKKKSEAAESKRKEKEGALGVFQEACWNQSKTLRPTFDAAIKGKKTKALFAGEILKITPVHHDGSALEERVKTLWGGDDKQYGKFTKAGKVSYASLPGFDLMGKVVASSSETPFANFIKKLNATDWVRQGHIHFAGQTDGKCPYCQQKLPVSFEDDLLKCFDAQYQENIAAISNFQSVYVSEMSSLVRTFESNLDDVLPGMNTDEYQAKVKNFKDAITINTQRIEAKVDELENMEELSGKDLKKLENYQNNQPVYEAIISALQAAVSEQVYDSPKAFMPVLTKVLANATADKKLLDKIADGLSAMDKNAEIQKDKKGNILYDKETKDTELVKWEESIDDYMTREVLPHVPDAKAFFEEDLGKKKPVIKTGAEIPFTRYFYKYQQPTPSEELEVKFMDLELSVSDRVSKLFE